MFRQLRAKNINYSPWKPSKIIHYPRPKICRIKQYSLSPQAFYTHNFPRPLPTSECSQPNMQLCIRLPQTKIQTAINAHGNFPKSCINPQLQNESSQANLKLCMKLYKMPQPTTVPSINSGVYSSRNNRKVFK